MNNSGSRVQGPGVPSDAETRRPGQTSATGGDRSQSKGFTLLEVLLALSILAVVVATVYGVFSSAGANVERAEELRGGTDRARTLVGRMANDISNTYLNGGIAETFLVGRKLEGAEKDQRFDSIALTTLTNWRKPDSREMELWEVGYFFVERPENKVQVLYRKEKRELSKDTPPMEGGADYELLDAVEGLRLRYSDGAKWTDEWDTRKQGRLPAAIEIVLTLADGKVYATQADIRSQ